MSWAYHPLLLGAAATAGSGAFTQSHTTDARLYKPVFTKTHTTDSYLRPVVFYDTFTEASNTTLESHTPNIGTSWTRTINNATDMAINGTTDRLDGGVASGGLSDGAFYTADATYPSANYYAEVTMVTGGTGDDTNTIAVRVQDSNNAYYVLFNAAFATLFKKVGGTITELDDAVTVPTNGDVVRLEIIGQNIKFYADGVEILSATDSSITAIGKAGLGIGDNFDQTRGEDVNDQELDNFVVVSLGGAGTFNLTHTTGSFLRKRQTATHTADAYKSLPVFSETHTTDALKTTNSALNTYVTAASADDAAEATDGTMDLTSTIEQISSANHAGFRFPSVTIAQGATIVSAYLKFEQLQSYSGGGNMTGVTVYGNDVDSAAQFTTTANDITGRTVTTASVVEPPADIDPFSGSNSGLDVTSIVQEIIDRVGWSSGNALAILFIGDETAASGTISPYMFDYSSNFYDTWLIVTTSDGGAREMRRWHFTDSYLAVAAPNYDVTHATDALKRDRNTLTHTTDSLKRDRNILTHTTNALLRDRNTLSHTTDAFKRARATLSQTTSSFLRARRTAAHTTNALLRAIDSVLHTTDALLKTRNQESHTADAFLRDRVSLAHTTDALLRDRVALTHTTNALLRGRYVEVHTTDSLLKDRFTLSHTIDSFLRDRVTILHTTNSLLRDRQSIAHTTNSLLRDVFIAAHSTDAYLLRTVDIDHTTDALLRDRVQLVHTTNSLLRDRVSILHTSDAMLKFVFTVAHTTNSLLRDRVPIAHTTNSLLRDRQSLSHSTDAMLFGEGIVLHTTDSLLRARDSLAHTTDGLLRLRVALTHTADSLKRARLVESHTTDASLSDSFVEIHTTDAMLHTLEELQHSTDTLIRLLGELAHTTDARLVGKGYRSHSSDSLLRGREILQQSVDSLLRLRESLTHTSDALLYDRLTLTHTTDSHMTSEQARMLRPQQLHGIIAIVPAGFVGRDVFNGRVEPDKPLAANSRQTVPDAVNVDRHFPRGFI